jgi:hypothetical protein
VRGSCPEEEEEEEEEEEDSCKLKRVWKFIANLEC